MGNELKRYLINGSLAALTAATMAIPARAQSGVPTDIASLAILEPGAMSNHLYLPMISGEHEVAELFDQADFLLLANVELAQLGVVTGGINLDSSINAYNQAEQEKIFKGMLKTVDLMARADKFNQAADGARGYRPPFMQGIQEFVVKVDPELGAGALTTINTDPNTGKPVRVEIAFGPEIPDQDLFAHASNEAVSLMVDAQAFAETNPVLGHVMREAVSTYGSSFATLYSNTGDPRTSQPVDSLAVASLKNLCLKKWYQDWDGDITSFYKLLSIPGITGSTDEVFFREYLTAIFTAESFWNKDEATKAKALTSALAYFSQQLEGNEGYTPSASVGTTFGETVQWMRDQSYFASDDTLYLPDGLYRMSTVYSEMVSHEGKDGAAILGMTVKVQGDEIELFTFPHEDYVPDNLVFTKGSQRFLIDRNAIVPLGLPDSPFGLLFIPFDAMGGRNTFTDGTEVYYTATIDGQTVGFTSTVNTPALGMSQ